MNVLVWALGVLPPIPFCVFRRKRYRLAWWQLILEHIVISLAGGTGACIGSFLAGGSIKGIRLYGLVLFIALFLPMVAKLIRCKLGRLGDFVSVPAAISCAAPKVNCLIDDCCRGFVLYQTDTGQYVRFPSQILELSLWLLLALFLLILERRKQSENLLWPIFMAWFGFLRYVVDFFRGSALEKRPFFFSMPGGRFWSLVVCLLGLVWLFFAMKDKLGRNPKFSDIFKALVGL